MTQTKLIVMFRINPELTQLNYISTLSTSIVDGWLNVLKFLSDWISLNIASYG